MSVIYQQSRPGDIGARRGAWLSCLLLSALSALPAAAQEAQSRPSAMTTAAQEAQSQPSTATAPAREETAVVTITATTVPVSSQPANPNGKLLLNFQEASLRSVLEYLSGAAGLMIVEEAKLDGRMTVISRQPVTVDEAVSLVDTVLRGKGLAAIRNGRILRIVTVDQAKKDLIPVRLGSDPNAIEPTDRMVTQVIPIRNADATKLKADLATLIPPTADVTSNVSSNTLIVTSTEATVRRIVEIVRAIDGNLTDVAQVKVFQLKYANAANAARLVMDIFRQDQSTTGTGGGGGGSPFSAMRRAFMGGGGGGGGGGGRSGGGGGGSGGNEVGQRTTRVTASADDRTNTLVVSASPEMLKVIEGVVKELDANPAEQQAFFVYRLRNGQSKNLESVLNNIFGFTGATSSGGSGGRTVQTGLGSAFGGGSMFGGSSSMGGRTGMGGSNRGMSSSGFGSAANRAGMSQTGGAFNQRTFASGAARLSSGSAVAASDLAGQVYIVADEYTNSLVVTTAPKNFDRVRQVIADLDRPVPQVLIKVLIAEVTHDNSIDLGAEFSTLNLSGSAQYAKPGGFTFTIDLKDFTAVINALAIKSKVDILSRPYILTADNQPAAIMIGQIFPFITNSQLTSEGTVNNTVSYQDIGIILNVTPHVNPQGLVTLDVAPEISSVDKNSQVKISNDVEAAVFNKRAAQSRVAILDGQTIVIGGLMEDRNNDVMEKVPGLGDIPLLGLLFQHKVTRKTKTELLIFLTPHVAKAPEELKAMSEDEQAGTKNVQNAIEPGVFQEHLKGMRRGASTRPATQDAQDEEVHVIPPAPQEIDNSKGSGQHDEGGGNPSPRPEGEANNSGAAADQE